jgi:hypothetical protein
MSYGRWSVGDKKRAARQEAAAIVQSMGVEGRQEGRKIRKSTHTVVLVPGTQ